MSLFGFLLLVALYIISAVVEADDVEMASVSSVRSFERMEGEVLR